MEDGHDDHLGIPRLVDDAVTAVDQLAETGVTPLGNDSTLQGNVAEEVDAAFESVEPVEGRLRPPFLDDSGEGLRSDLKGATRPGELHSGIKERS